jgi:hypothetical protein
VEHAAKIQQNDGKSAFFWQNVCWFQKKAILLQAINKKRVTMIQMNAYFYGYYFYFASNCEAGRCM